MTAAYRSGPQRGSALLAVLWLSVALSAIAFALSRSVRTELDRAAFSVESTRAYYLARGAIQRTMLHMLRPATGISGNQRFRPGQNWIRFNFPNGRVDVEIEGEGGKLDINSASPEALARVLSATGLDPTLAVGVAARIVQARSQAPWAAAGASGANVTAPSTFSGSRASFRELEELLLIPGITADILYGTYFRGQDGQLLRVGGLNRQLTVFGSPMIDAGYAPPELLRASGIDPGAVQAILQIRASRPLQSQDPGIANISQQVGPLRVGLIPGSRAYTLRATARVNQGRGVRRVAALVKMAEQPTDPPVRVLRWHESDL